MSTYDRIKEEQKIRRNKLLKRIFTLLLLALFAIGGYKLLCQPWFSFGTLYITGTEKLMRDDILFLTQLEEPVNFFVMDKTEIKKNLEKDIRIKKADVNYEFPNIININIIEEKPLFYAECQYGYIGVNTAGTVLNAAKSIKDGDAPILSGITCKSPFIGDTVYEENFVFIKDFLNSLDLNARYFVSEINVDNSSKVKIIDRLGRPYLLGDIKNIIEKSRAFGAVIKEFSQKNVAVEFVDLSYSKPYIKIKKIDK